MMKTRSSRCISSRSAWFRASRYVMTGIAVRLSVRGRRLLGPGVARRLDQHVLPEALEGRLRARVGEVPGVLDRRLDLLVHLLHVLVGDLAALLHVAAQQ